jgi:hypothetical protein
MRLGNTSVLVLMLVSLLGRTPHLGAQSLGVISVPSAKILSSGPFTFRVRLARPQLSDTSRGFPCLPATSTSYQQRAFYRS